MGDRSRLFEGVELRQNLSAVAERVHAQERFRNPPVGIDQERVSRGELYDRKIVQRSIGIGHFVIGVGQQLESQALLGAELLVRIDAVEADSQDNRVALGVLGLVHLELVGFARSARGLVFGIEVKDDPLAAVILEADWAIRRWQGEIWSHASLRGPFGA